MLKNWVAMWLEGKQRLGRKPPIKSGRTEVSIFSELAARVPSVGTTNACNNDLGLALQL